MPICQLLVYPVTDRRMGTKSNKIYVDTPMWNSTLSAKMWKGYLPNTDVENVCYASPMEAKMFEFLPSAYVETTEFDCLRDEGKEYAEALQKADVEVVFFEVKGAMHGFDIKQKAPTTQKRIKKRIEYLKTHFQV